MQLIMTLLKKKQVAFKKHKKRWIQPCQRLIGDYWYIPPLVFFYLLSLLTPTHPALCKCIHYPSSSLHLSWILSTSLMHFSSLPPSNLNPSFPSPLPSTLLFPPLPLTPLAMSLSQMRLFSFLDGFFIFHQHFGKDFRASMSLEIKVRKFVE